MPIDYKKYPPNWKELREQVLKRAKNKCEFCKIENGAVGYRMPSGEFFTEKRARQIFQKESEIFASGGREIKIVLTIAHLDHDEENHNVKLERLAALCQRCHLRYDIPEKKRRRKNKKAIGDLFK